MKKYRDHYFLKAKQDNYPARSVYKLKEMDRAFGLLGPGLKVLDLGACPGSWTMYAAEKVGPSGRVLAVDLNPLPVALPGQATFLQEDVFERSPGFETLLREWSPFDLVLSDMAPKTTGIKHADQAKSHYLAEEALGLARLVLRPGGNFAVKIFFGPDVQGFTMILRQEFTQVKTFKPKSSRSESKEIFLVGRGRKQKPNEGPPGN
ncbi:MAG: RlmE family RNA methyltransferase [Deltaproteobacteria bacterium]|nr:RlmE family RNA methyltransferase [Deltaproteobacteria bacterium]